MLKNIFAYTDYRTYLNDVYLHMKSRRAIVSHRYIEQKTGISQGYFSRILKGTKNISDKVIIRFIGFLNLSKNEARFFENLVKYSQAHDQSAKMMYYSRMMATASPSVTTLVKEQFSYFTEIHHVAVRALIQLVPVSDTSDFATLGQLLRPPVSGAEVKESLALLLKLDLIEKNDSGIYHVTDRIISTGNLPGDMLIRTHLRNALKLAASALDIVPQKDRMASVMTISVSDETYTKIIDLLAQTRQQINTLIEHEHDASRIYQVSMNMIPVSVPVTKDISHAE